MFALMCAPCLTRSSKTLGPNGMCRHRCEVAVILLPTPAVVGGHRLYRAADLQGCCSVRCRIVRDPVGYCYLRGLIPAARNTAPTIASVWPR